MSLHRVDGNEQLVRDLLIAQAERNQFQHFQFALAQPEFFKILFVELKCMSVHGHFNRLGFGELTARPNAEGGKQQRHDAAVNLHRMIEDHIPVFDELQQGNREAQDHAVKDQPLHPSNVWKEPADGNQVSGDGFECNFPEDFYITYHEISCRSAVDRPHRLFHFQSDQTKTTTTTRPANRTGTRRGRR